MFVETTYPSREITQQINALVGTPFKIVDRIKMGGIGSKRMAIEKVSPEYNEYLNPEYYVTQGNIELRPKGIIIHFRYKLESYAWIMPYTGLEIFTDDKLIFKSDGKLIQFKNGIEVNGKFVDRLVSLKNAFTR